MNSSLGAGTDPDEQAAAPLIGVAAWPAARTGFRLGGSGSRPELAVTVSPDAGLPGPEDSPQATARSAADRAQRYRTIGAQLDEPGCVVSLRISLDPSRSLPAAAGVESLRRFARSAELFAQAVAAATAPELGGIATLGELLDRYGLTADRLAAANADLPLNQLLAAGQPLAMRTGQIDPDTVPAGIDTLAQVAAALRVRPGQFLEDNRGLRLAAEAATVLPGIIALPPGTRIPYSVTDGDTLTALARRFATTPRELVAGNAEVPGTLLPGIRVEVAVTPDPELNTATAFASTDTVAGDSFAAVRTRLAGQHAEVDLDAVADALDRLGPVLGTGPVLSCPLAVLGSGRNGDGPLTAAEAAADFGCPPVTFAAANAGLPGLVQPGVRLSCGDLSTTTAEQDTLHAVLARLVADPDLPWPDRLDRLLAGHAAVPLFRSGARALLPPHPVTLMGSSEQALEPVGPAVALTVTLRLARGEEHADTEVKPGPDRDDLVEACLTTLPGVRLATDPEGTVWAVPFGSTGISAVRITPAADQATHLPAFGLPALYPTLIAFTVAISPVTDQGELGPPVPRQLTGIDTELWARTFVTDLDRCLAEPLRGLLPAPARAALSEIRRQLIATLADSLVPVWHGAPDRSTPATARTALVSLARTGLAPAYLASVLAQYPANVTAPYGGDGQPAARLVGELQASGCPDLDLAGSRIELAPAAAGCTLALGCAYPSRAATVTVSPRQALTALELDVPGKEPVLLRFVRPLTGSYHPAADRAELPPTELPLAELPVPLRGHPYPVAVRPMTATATFAGRDQLTLAEAMQWTASLSYTHEHAAQDVVQVAIGQRPAASGPVATPRNLALAEALARYAVAAPELIGFIAAEDPPPAGPDPRREHAAEALTGLAAAVGTAWRDHRAERPPTEAPGVPNRVAGLDETRLAGSYRLRAVYAGDPDAGHLLDRLVVSRTGAAGAWPQIAVEAGDRQLALTPGPVAEDTCEYAATERLTAPATLTVRLDWPGLTGVPAPGAAIALSVRRNLVLAGVSSEFLLTAEPVRVEVAGPALRWEGSLPLDGGSLGSALRHAFEVLAGGHPERRATIAVHYAEPFGEVQHVQSALLAEAALVPDSAASLAAAMQDWQSRALPTVAEGAVWQLRFTVHSPRDGEPPLVTFEQLVYPVSPGGEPALVPVPVGV